MDEVFVRNRYGFGRCAAGDEFGDDSLPLFTFFLLDSNIQNGGDEECRKDDLSQNRDEAKVFSCKSVSQRTVHKINP